MKVLARWVIGLALVWGVCAPPVWSEPPPISPPPRDKVDEYLGQYNLHPALAKGGRGVANFLTGWMEIPYNIHEHYTEGDMAASWFTGLAYGVVKGTARTAVGLYEAVTFFMPYPEDCKPILPPLPYFVKDKHRPPLPLE